VKTSAIIVAASCLLMAPPTLAQTYGTMADASLGVDASLNGDVSFPADNAWNTDISTMPASALRCSVRWRSWWSAVFCWRPR
jgi:hypothetical protein